MEKVAYVHKCRFMSKLDYVYKDKTGKLQSHDGRPLIIDLSKYPNEHNIGDGLPIYRLCHCDKESMFDGKAMCNIKIFGNDSKIGYPRCGWVILCRHDKVLHPLYQTMDKEYYYRYNGKNIYINPSRYEKSDFTLKDGSIASAYVLYR